MSDNRSLQGHSGNNLGGKNNNTSGLNKQNQNYLDNMADETITAYENMYGDIKKEHQDFLTKDSDSIKKTEEKAYDDITKAIGKKYEDLYKGIAEQHKNLIKSFNEDLKTLGITVSPSSTNTTNNDTVNNTLLKLNETLDSLVETLNNAPKDSDSNNRQKRLFKGKSKNVESARQLEYINGKISTIARDINSSLVAGKESSKMVGFAIKGFDRISDVVTSFMAQEKVGDSIVGVIMWLLESVLEFLGQGVQEQYNTREELFTRFEVYNNTLKDGLSYDAELQEAIFELNKRGLSQNIKSTEVMKQLVDLTQAGFSTDEALNASIESSILKTIAPHLETTSEIFKDFQQRGMEEIIGSLGGLVQSVRANEGSSRITVSSLNTLIQKLGPVELYAKKGLFGKDATRALSALEASGMSTEDAITLVSEASDVINNPYKALTGGNIAQKIAASRGEYGSLSEVISSMFGTYADYTSTTSGSPLHTGAVFSALGSGLNVYGNYQGMYSAYQAEYDRLSDIADVLESEGKQEKQPSDYYKEMVDLLEGNQLQTGEQMSEIAKVNSWLSVEMSSWMAEIVSEYLLPITESVLAIAENTLGSALFGNVRGKIEERKEQIAQKDLMSALETNDQKALNKAIADLETSASNKLEARQDYLSSNLYGSGIAVLGDRILNAITFGHYEGTGVEKAYKSSMSQAQQEYADTQELISKAKKVKFGAEGAYVTSPTPYIVGEAGPEIIAPEPKLLENVVKGVSIATNNAEIVAVVREATQQIVNAIYQNGGGLTYNTKTGLMNNGNASSVNTSLRSIMAEL